jgi:hypothetical protein
VEILISKHKDVVLCKPRNCQLVRARNILELFYQRKHQRYLDIKGIVSFDWQRKTGLADPVAQEFCVAVKDAGKNQKVGKIGVDLV